MYKLKLYDVAGALVFYCESDTIWGVFSQYDEVMGKTPVEYERAIIAKDDETWLTTTILERLKKVLGLF